MYAIAAMIAATPIVTPPTMPAQPAKLRVFGSA